MKYVSLFLCILFLTIALGIEFTQGSLSIHLGISCYALAAALWTGYMFRTWPK